MSMLKVDQITDSSGSGSPSFPNGVSLAGTIPVANGGTGSSTPAGARTNLGAASSGANTDITSLGSLTIPLSVSQGGTGTSTSTGSGAVVLSNSPTLTSPNLGTPTSLDLSNATNLNIISGTFGVLSVSRGGTASTTAPAARTALGAAASGNNTDILTLAGFSGTLDLLGRTAGSAGSSPASGRVGEVVVSSVSQVGAITITSGVVTELLSLPVTTGIWLLWGQFAVTGTATNVTRVRAEISTVSGAFGNPPGGGSVAGGDGSAYNTGLLGNSTVVGGNDIVGSLSPVPVFLTGSATYHLVFSVTTGAGAKAYGKLVAVRIA